MYKRQAPGATLTATIPPNTTFVSADGGITPVAGVLTWNCLLYTSDAADERSRGDLGGPRIIKKNNTKKKKQNIVRYCQKVQTRSIDKREQEETCDRPHMGHST